MNKILYYGLIAGCVLGVLAIFMGYHLAVFGIIGAILVGIGVFAFFVEWKKLFGVE